MRPEVNSNRFEIHFGVKFDFGVRLFHDQGSHDFRRAETHFGANFNSLSLTEVNIHTAVNFLWEQ